MTQFSIDLQQQQQRDALNGCVFINDEFKRKNKPSVELHS